MVSRLARLDSPLRKLAFGSSLERGVAAWPSSPCKDARLTV